MAGQLRRCILHRQLESIFSHRFGGSTAKELRKVDSIPIKAIALPNLNRLSSISSIGSAQSTLCRHPEVSCTRALPIERSTLSESMSMRSGAESACLDRVVQHGRGMQVNKHCSFCNQTNCGRYLSQRNAGEFLRLFIARLTVSDSQTANHHRRCGGDRMRKEAVDSVLCWNSRSKSS